MHSFVTTGSRHCSAQMKGVLIHVAGNKRIVRWLANSSSPSASPSHERLLALGVAGVGLSSLWGDFPRGQCREVLELQRSITMIQISKRQIKIRQKFTKSSWSLWRACGLTSIVEALLRAARVICWTFSMATRKQGAQIRGFSSTGKKGSCQELCKVPVIFSFCFRQPLWSWESRKVKS